MSHTTRRAFLKATATTGCAMLIKPVTGLAQNAKPDQPNILWITVEDISPHLGCYGDAYAHTPVLDKLARKSVLYTNAFAPIGVCAPARSCLITGMYPNSIGSQHMRSKGKLPGGVHFYPWYLRKAGYYCTNNAKMDYNLPNGKGAWDQCDRKAHWKNRQATQPFFAIMNLTNTHESGIWPARKPKSVPGGRHDPAGVMVPPYHPDTPNVRRDWAQLYDQVSVMDQRVGQILNELKEAKLADDTIVFFYSDHGTGMPRSKRWLYDSSLKVPMLIYFPKKYQHLAPGKPGTKTDRLVSFVDFAPTLLSLCDIKPPDYMQGQSFMGTHVSKPRQFVFGYRGRMDERFDMIRCVRDKRFKYIRNFMPHKPYAQHLEYMYRQLTMQDWQKLYDQGKLNDVQKKFFLPKPVEELYDTQKDPHEVNNLAGDPAYKEKLLRLRTELLIWMLGIRDLGLLPEAELNTRYSDTPAYDAVRADPESYPIADLLKTIRLADAGKDGAKELLTMASHKDPAVRYWVAVGLLRTSNKSEQSMAALDKMLGDAKIYVRVAAADALAKFGQPEKALPVLTDALKNDNQYVRLQAINVLDEMDEAARPALKQIKAVRNDQLKYVGRVADKTIKDLE